MCLTLGVSYDAHLTDCDQWMAIDAVMETHAIYRTCAICTQSEPGEEGP